LLGCAAALDGSERPCLHRPATIACDCCRLQRVSAAMEQAQAPLLDALADYHRSGRYGFSPPGHRQGRGVDERALAVLGKDPFFATTSWPPTGSTIGCRAAGCHKLRI
jgi:hypothetical protein